jgi:hypothetical protein
VRLCVESSVAISPRVESSVADFAEGRRGSRVAEGRREFAEGRRGSPRGPRVAEGRRAVLRGRGSSFEVILCVINVFSPQILLSWNSIQFKILLSWNSIHFFFYCHGIQFKIHFVANYFDGYPSTADISYI